MLEVLAAVAGRHADHRSAGPPCKARGRRLSRMCAELEKQRGLPSACVQCLSPESLHDVQWFARRPGRTLPSGWRHNNQTRSSPSCWRGRGPRSRSCRSMHLTGRPAGGSRGVPLPACCPTCGPPVPRGRARRTMHRDGQFRLVLASLRRTGRLIASCVAFRSSSITGERLSLRRSVVCVRLTMARGLSWCCRQAFSRRSSPVSGCRGGSSPTSSIWTAFIRCSLCWRRAPHGGSQPGSAIYGIDITLKAFCNPARGFVLMPYTVGSRQRPAGGRAEGLGCGASAWRSMSVSRAAWTGSDGCFVSGC